jgi:NAD-dependent dihydropyrimidine dehydrogenase PreA subunit
MEIIVDESKCNGCGKCLQVCPKGPRVWRIEEQGDRKIAKVMDIDYCLNCGNCVAFCPTSAIEIRWYK